MKRLCQGRAETTFHSEEYYIPVISSRLRRSKCGRWWWRSVCCFLVLTEPCNWSRINITQEHSMPQPVRYYLYDSAFWPVFRLPICRSCRRLEDSVIVWRTTVCLRFEDSSFLQLLPNVDLINLILPFLFMVGCVGAIRAPKTSDISMCEMARSTRFV